MAPLKPCLAFLLPEKTKQLRLKTEKKQYLYLMLYELVFAAQQPIPQQMAKTLALKIHRARTVLWCKLAWLTGAILVGLGCLWLSSISWV